MPVDVSREDWARVTAQCLLGHQGDAEGDGVGTGDKFNRLRYFA